MTKIPALLHIGIMVYDKPSSIAKSFMKFCNYREIPVGHPDLNKEIIRVVIDFQPDIIFMQIQSDKVSIDTLKWLKQRGIKTVHWTGDLRQPTPDIYVQMGKYMDCVYFTNMTDVRYMRAVGLKSDFLQIGYDETIYKPANVVKDIDVVFMANHYGSFPLSPLREKVAEYVKNRGFKLYGRGWKNADGNVNHSQEEEAAIYQRAKIAINVSHFDLERYTSDRMFRILGCGTLCLTHDYTAIEQDFTDGENVVVWHNFQDLEEKINYYLANEGERERIAKNGLKLAQEKYTFDNMVKNILSL